MENDLMDVYSQDSLNIDIDEAISNISGSVGTSDDENQDDSYENKIARAIAEGNEIARKFYEIERAKELKAGEIYRKTDKELLRNSDGTLENDSSWEIKGKEAYNKGVDVVDWVLEASENLIDIGQGDWLDHAHMKAVRDGKEHNMSNKDFSAAENTTLQALINEYQTAAYDPMADKAIYTLRRFDGYDENGNPKYVYKHGLAEVSAADRYRNQWMDDGFEIVEEKRFKGAEKWENTLHALTESLNARVFDEGGVMKDGVRMGTDKASNSNFGAGYTEIYDRNLLGTEDPDAEQFKKNEIISEYLMKERDATRIAGSNWVDAIQSGGLKLIAGAADTTLDILTPGGDNDWLNKYNDQEWIDKKVGYDRTEANQTLNEAAWKLENGDIIGGFTTAISNPEVAAESLPMMIAMFAPIPGTRVAGAAKIASTLAKAKKAGAPTKAIEAYRASLIKHAGPKAAATFERYENAPQALAAMNHLAKNGGFYGVAASLTNDQLNERIENKILAGEPGEVNMAEVMGAFALNTGLLAIDRLSFGNAAGFGAGKALLDKGIKTAINNTIDMMDNTGRRVFLKALGKKAKDIVIDSGFEAGQEYAQTWGEILIANYGIDGKTIMDVFSDAGLQHEAMMGLAGGMGAGAQISAITGGAKGAWHAGKYMMQTEEERKAAHITNMADLTKDDGVDSGTIENYIVQSIYDLDKPILTDFDPTSTGSVKQAVDAMIQKFSGQKNLDENQYKMLQKQYMKSIINKAFAVGQQNVVRANSPMALESVIRMANMLDADPDVDFKISDVLDTRMHDLAVEIANNLREADDISARVKEYKLEHGAEPSEDQKNEWIKEQRLNAYMSSMDQLAAERATQASFAKGSVAYIMGEETQIDDSLLHTSPDGLNIKTLTDLLAKYAKNSNQKAFDDVAKEISKFGFIDTQIIKHGPNAGKKEFIVKPSMMDYDRALFDQFLNDDYLKQIGSELNKNSRSANFENFAKWAESRPRKLDAKLSKDGNPIHARHTVHNLMAMKEENSWFSQKVQQLKDLMAARDSGTLSEEQFKKIEGLIEKVESDVVAAEKLQNDHLQKIKDFAEKNLGVTGIDLNNEEHRKYLTGIYTDYGINKQSNIKSFGNMLVEPMDKFGNIEDTMRWKRDKLLSLPGVTASQSDISLDGVDTKATKKRDGKKQKQKNHKTILTNLITGVDKYVELIKKKNELKNNGEDTTAIQEHLGALADFFKKTGIPVAEINNILNSRLNDDDVKQRIIDAYNTANNISTEAKPTTFKEQIAGFASQGIIESINGKEIWINESGNRPFVIAKINGVLIPFYQSSKGTDGKTPNAWYPFFGFQDKSGWLIKGPDLDTLENGMNVPEIKAKMNELNRLFPDSIAETEVNNQLQMDKDSRKYLTQAQLDQKYPDGSVVGSSMQEINKMLGDIVGYPDNKLEKMELLYRNSKDIINRIEQNRSEEVIEELTKIEEQQVNELIAELVIGSKNLKKAGTNHEVWNAYYHFSDTLVRVLKDTENLNIDELKAPVKSAIKNVLKSINRDITDLDKKTEELKNEKSALNSAKKLGVIAKVLTGVRRKIRRLGEIIMRLLSDLTMKRDLRDKLNEIKKALDNGGDIDSLIQMVEDSKTLMHDMYKMQKFFSKIPKSNKAFDKFFEEKDSAVAKKYPKLMKVYKRIHKTLSHIKRKTSEEAKTEAPVATEPTKTTEPVSPDNEKQNIVNEDGTPKQEIIFYSENGDKIIGTLFKYNDNQAVYLTTAPSSGAEEKIVLNYKTRTVETSGNKKKTVDKDSKPGATRETITAEIYSLDPQVKVEPTTESFGDFEVDFGSDMDGFNYEESNNVTINDADAKVEAAIEAAKKEVKQIKKDC